MLQTYFNNKEYRRAHSLLNKPELFAINMRYRYLAAMCMAACQEWEACLAIIGTEDIPETLNEKVSPPCVAPVCTNVLWCWRHVHVAAHCCKYGHRSCRQHHFNCPRAVGEEGGSA